MRTTTAPTPRVVSDERAVALLEGMIAIPSVSGQESRVAAYIAASMRELGLAAHLDEAGNAVGTTAAQPGGTIDIALLGHMDTVPGEVPVRREGDLLYGRGAVDAKGPLAAFIVAAATAVLPARVRLVVIGAVEEEMATSRGARHAASGLRPAACIIGEPSHWHAVTIGYKGRLLVEYKLMRPTAHTAGAEPGVADQMVAWWSAVLSAVARLNDGRSGAFDTVQARLRTIDTTSDGLIDSVRATAGFRLPPGVEPAEIEAVCRAAAGMGATLAFNGHEIAHVSDRHTPLVRSFTTAIREAGGAPGLRVKTGTSDMNVVAPVWKCPIIAYGPGDSMLDHTPNEHISIAEYLRSIRVLRAAVERLAAELVSDAPTSH